MLRAGVGVGIALFALLLLWSGGTGTSGDVLGALLSPAQMQVGPVTAVAPASFDATGTVTL